MGLPDKTVAESKERIRSALSSIGISLPPKKIVVNLSPANLQKEGSYFDLAIALGILISLQSVSNEDIANYIVMGELALDSRLTEVNGVLPAAILAAKLGKGIICPVNNGQEAAWAHKIDIIAAPDLVSLISHIKGKQLISLPKPCLDKITSKYQDIIDIKGQESTKRSLEIAAAGGHNILLQGPPGAGKSMLASRLPSLLPPLTPKEALEVTMIHSIAGQLHNGKLLTNRPFREPHHSSSLPAIVGGGSKAKPGEISLAHNGVLFLDELPEFSRSTLETMRQPLETGKIMVARANAHITYPANFQLIAAMNPCKCGYLDDAARACSRAPKCSVDYQAKLSGPLLDRIDINVFVPEVTAIELTSVQQGESSKDIAERVLVARTMQQNRLNKINNKAGIYVNAKLPNEFVDNFAIDTQARTTLAKSVEKFKFSARGYYKILRLSSTIADLDHSRDIRHNHISEAINYRPMYNYTN